MSTAARPSPTPSEVDTLEAWRGVAAEHAEEITAAGTVFLRHRSRRLLRALLWTYRRLLLSSSPSCWWRTVPG